MLIGIAVRLLIPDTTAVSARRALQGQGLGELRDLRREVCWEFDAEGDVEATAARLLRTDVLVNQNKCRARWWRGPLEAADAAAPAGAALPAACLLVEARDDPELPAMQRVLSARLGFAGLRVLRHATLWLVVGTAGTDGPELARRAARMLLVNPHGQLGTVLGAGPSPVGGPRATPN